MTANQTEDLFGRIRAQCSMQVAMFLQRCPEWHRNQLHAIADVHGFQAAVSAAQKFANQAKHPEPIAIVHRRVSHPLGRSHDSLAIAIAIANENIANHGGRPHRVVIWHYQADVNEQVYYDTEAAPYDPGAVSDDDWKDY